MTTHGAKGASDAHNTRCVVLLGGSFDPVHNGHIAMGKYAIDLFTADELRIVPAGMPWQKGCLHASAEDRVAMLHRAFHKSFLPVAIDLQEIQRHTANYTIDTLQAMRADMGSQVSIVLLIGADQLQHLDTWKQWRQLFDYAHICAVTRPGFGLEALHLPIAVADEFARRAAMPQHMRQTACGLAHVAKGLAIDVSATAIRAALQRGERPDLHVPPEVLDYIESHHLYQN